MLIKFFLIICIIVSLYRRKFCNGHIMLVYLVKLKKKYPKFIWLKNYIFHVIVISISKSIQYINYKNPLNMLLNACNLLRNKKFRNTNIANMNKLSQSYSIFSDFSLSTKYFSWSCIGKIMFKKNNNILSTYTIKLFFLLKIYQFYKLF